jgi:hypothetical protein
MEKYRAVLLLEKLFLGEEIDYAEYTQLEEEGYITRGDEGIIPSEKGVKILEFSIRDLLKGKTYI